MMNNSIDDTDLRILKLLQENARMTGQQIGDKLHKTATPINNRIRSLQERGFIKRYVAVLDHELLGLDFMAFTHVQLKDHSKASLVHFESEIIKFPEVLECYHLTGPFDFILRIAVSDRHAYHDFLMNKLFAIMAVGKVETTLVMKEAKSGTALPIGEFNSH